MNCAPERPGFSFADQQAAEAHRLAAAPSLLDALLDLDGEDATSQLMADSDTHQRVPVGDRA